MHNATGQGPFSGPVLESHANTVVSDAVRGVRVVSDAVRGVRVVSDAVRGTVGLGVGSGRPACSVAA